MVDDELLVSSVISYIISIIVSIFVAVGFLKFSFLWTEILNIILGSAFGIALYSASDIAESDGHYYSYHYYSNGIDDRTCRFVECVTAGIAFGIASGIAENTTSGVVISIAFGIAFSIIILFTFGIVGIFIGITGCFFCGIALFIISNINSIFLDIIGDVGGIVVFDIILIIIGILIAYAVNYFELYLFIELFLYLFQIHYLFSYLKQYFRAKYTKDNPFELFLNSPVHLPQEIVYKLPFMSKFLLILTEKNRDKGIKEIEFVSINQPRQREAAFETLLQITIKDLSEIKSIKGISDASGNLSFLSLFENFLPKEFSKTLRIINDLSIDARSYLNSSSNFNRLKNLNNLENDIFYLKNSLIATRGLVGVKFLSLAETWSQIVEDEKKQFKEMNTDSFKEIPNPYIFGNPVKADNSSRLFVGRKDIVDLIQSNLTSSISQKPALFIYGRRRVGKSSVLVNLSNLLEKQYIPVYLDFQDPKYGESQSSFCYHLSKLICDSLNDRGFPFEYPPLGSFQNSPFTTFGSWLDKTEELLEKENKLVLICFDEYEKIEERILNGSLTKDILDQLRNIIQHRKCFVILISGSNELRELQLNWSDYLINTKMIKISYLSKDDARILITNPIDDFTVSYEGGQYGEAVNQIINSTSCQPYLVQAVCFELVNYLNSQGRKEASVKDVNLAAERVLASANAYFDYIWNIECTDSEKNFLHKMIENSYTEGTKKEIDSLLRREVIEKDRNAYKFKVPLMKKWIEKDGIYN